MSDADFGVYDRAKFAVSFWYKLESTGTTRFPIAHGAGAANMAFEIRFSSADKIQIQTQTAASTPDGNLVTTATYTDTASFHHFLFHFDSANATAGDRMKLWIDGAEVTSFDTDTNPTAAIYNTAGDITIGDQGGALFDGLLYQFAIFSGTLPAIGTLYNAGAPMDIRLLTGLYSLLDVSGGDVTTDYVLTPNWTNVNTATASSTIP